jgi:UDP-N-acetylmuramyl pentapeptide phosphotransferase/UDP-N-acetylglucosamine-1-phosphate transferase
MDGLDGLLSGCFLLILSRSIYAISPELSILLGSLFVFFIFNWSPAKIFMGDTGSTFLGGIYFIILLNSSNISGFFINLLISTPLLLDSLTCIMIRLFKKQNIFKPHKKHLYQRLNQAGFKHSTVSLIYILATLFLVVFSTFNNILYLIMACIAIVFVGFYLNAKYAIEFN